MIDRINIEYNRWLKNMGADEKMMKELIFVKKDEKLLYDSFCCELSFGTGGLRGLMGPGTNRMNIYMVAKISQAVSNYIKKNFGKFDWKVAISYDSRINSDLFSEISASVFAANGIHVNLYKQLMPTPCLSYAIRELKCCMGVMITASHNSYEYNGYKVYDKDGCQITNSIAEEISAELSHVDIFDDVKKKKFKQCIEEGLISYIDNCVYSNYLDNVNKQSVLYGDEIDRKISIVYTPLNGTGLIPIIDILKKHNFHNVFIVEEQRFPNGLFPTSPYPNLEDENAMVLGIQYAKRYNADVLIATDPDCDRVGIAIKEYNNNYQLLTGNETGILLLDFICSQRIKHQKMPIHPKVVKSIVTTNMAEKIAKKYNVEVINVLTGFKYIGEYIGQLEKEDMENSYVFGFEESCGYLSGTYVRDKDAVNGVLLICEMVGYYSALNISIKDKLNDLYKEYGHNFITSHSYQFQGKVGIIHMDSIMDKFRTNLLKFGNKKIEKVYDYMKCINHLPKSNVIQFKLENDCSVIVRPSGTEPKLKIYISVNAKDNKTADEIVCLILNDLDKIINS